MMPNPNVKAILSHQFPLEPKDSTSASLMRCLYLWVCVNNGRTASFETVAHELQSGERSLFRAAKALRNGGYIVTERCGNRDAVTTWYVNRWIGGRWADERSCRPDREQQNPKAITMPDTRHELNERIAQAMGWQHDNENYWITPDNRIAVAVWFDHDGEPDWRLIHRLWTDLITAGWMLMHDKEGVRWVLEMTIVAHDDLAVAPALAWLRMKGVEVEE